MSNETMTEALQRMATMFRSEAASAAASDQASNAFRQCAEEVDELAERLRGEAAQEGQAVAFKGWYCAHCQRGVDASEVTNHEQHEVCGRVITDDRPQPVAVAGDAVHEIVSDIRQSAKVDDYEVHQIALLESIADRLAALSAAPAAPETDTVLIGQAVCYGDDWFKELTVEGVTFLAPLDDHERARLILAAKKRRKQEDAPAPVAGDAVDVSVDLMDLVKEMGDLYGSRGCVLTVHVNRLIELTDTLAQDRASQAGAAGVPDGVMQKLLSAQRTPNDRARQYLLDEAISMLAAAPTPAAEREVGND